MEDTKLGEIKTDSRSPETLELVQHYIREIAQFECEIVYSGSEEGFNLKNEVDFLILFFRRVQNVDWSLLSDWLLGRIKDPLKNCINVLNEIKKGVPNDSNIFNFLARTQDAFKGVYDQMFPLLQFLDFENSELYGMRQEFNELKEKSLKEIEVSRTEIEKNLELSKEGAAAISEAAGKSGVSKHARDFAEAAKHYTSMGWCWFAGTLVMAATTAYLVYKIIYVPFNDLMSEAVNVTATANQSVNSILMIQLTFSKILLISVSFFVLLWAARNYKVNRHLAVVNRHRQHALATFHTFVSAAEDRVETRDAVLLEATRCIFSPSVTGYLGKEEDAAINPVVNILKTMGRDTGPG